MSGKQVSRTRLIEFATALVHLNFSAAAAAAVALLRASPFSAIASLGFVHTGPSSDASCDVRPKSSASRIERVTAVSTKN